MEECVFLSGGERSSNDPHFRLSVIFTKMAVSPAPQGSLPSAPLYKPHFVCPTSDGLLPPNVCELLGVRDSV